MERPSKLAWKSERRNADKAVARLSANRSWTACRILERGLAEFG
jgi:hypothetical protein